MKKQFFRVKHLADQTVGRAEKTEVLSEDLLGVEKRVESIRHASNAFVKKISTGLTGHGFDLEKRLKKIPETYISSSLVEYSLSVGENTPMGSALRYCGEAMSYVGRDTLEYELDLEKKVFQPVNTILENYIPIINKFKKQLSKQTLEMDISKARYNEMLRRSYCSVNDASANATKIDSLKDDYVDSCNKLDHIKDAYATEMFKFLSKEGEISHIILNLLEVKIEYHKNVLNMLENVLNKARDYLSCNSQVKPAFGCPLQEYLEFTNTHVSPIIEECVTMLLDIGLDEVGLFRMTGSTSKMKKLKSAFDSGTIVDLHDFMQDPHVITGILKWYLRDLPEPILTYKLYEEWRRAAKINELVHVKSEEDNNETLAKTIDAELHKEKIKRFKCLLQKLPCPNYDNLNYLIQFLSLVVEHSNVNLMSYTNLGIVMGPNLLWKQGDNGMDLASTNIQNSVAEFLIVNAKELFPNKIDFRTFDNSHPNPIPSSTKASALNSDCQGPDGSATTSLNHLNAMLIPEIGAPDCTLTRDRYSSSLCGGKDEDNSRREATNLNDTDSTNKSVNQIGNNNMTNSFDFTLAGLGAGVASKTRYRYNSKTISSDNLTSSPSSYNTKRPYYNQQSRHKNSNLLFLPSAVSLVSTDKINSQQLLMGGGLRNHNISSPLLMTSSLVLGGSNINNTNNHTQPPSHYEIIQDEEPVDTMTSDDCSRSDLDAFDHGFPTRSTPPGTTRSKYVELLKLNTSLPLVDRTDKEYESYSNVCKSKTQQQPSKTCSPKGKLPKQVNEKKSTNHLQTSLLLKSTFESAANILKTASEVSSHKRDSHHPNEPCSLNISRQHTGDTNLESAVNTDFDKEKYSSDPADSLNLKTSNSNLEGDKVVLSSKQFLRNHLLNAVNLNHPPTSPPHSPNTSNKRSENVISNYLTLNQRDNLVTRQLPKSEYPELDMVRPLCRQDSFKSYSPVPQVPYRHRKPHYHLDASVTKTTKNWDHMILASADMAINTPKTQNFPQEDLDGQESMTAKFTHSSPYNKFKCHTLSSTQQHQVADPKKASATILLDNGGMVHSKTAFLNMPICPLAHPEESSFGDDASSVKITQFRDFVSPPDPTAVPYKEHSPSLIGQLPAAITYHTHKPPLNHHSYMHLADHENENIKNCRLGMTSSLTSNKVPLNSKFCYNKIKPNLPPPPKIKK